MTWSPSLVKPRPCRGISLFPSSLAKHVSLCAESTQGLFFFLSFCFSSVCYSCQSPEQWHCIPTSSHGVPLLYEWGTDGPWLSCPVLSFCAWPNCLGHSGCSRHLCWMKKWREGWWREWVLQGGIVDWGFWLHLWIRRAVVWWLPGRGAQLSRAQWGRQVTGGPGEMRK